MICLTLQETSVPATVISGVFKNGLGFLVT